MTVADVRVDVARHDVTVAGAPVSLTRKEFQILALLATARGTVVTRGRIVAEVWGRSWSGRTGRSTCTSRRCARSSGARSWWRRCAGWATGSGLPRRRRPRGSEGVRARLLVIVLVVIGLVAVVLGGLLAWTTAQAAQQGFFTRRVTDTVYVASLVQRPVTDAEGADLRRAAERYRQVYGVMVHVVAADGTPFAPAVAPDLDDEGRGPPRRRAGRTALGAAPAADALDDAPLVIAEPVLVDGEVRGAVVTVSPTAALHERELETWGLITAAVLLALGLGVLVSLPVVRWILHPVHRLDEGTGRARAVLAGGAAAPVADDSGPPELRRLSASFDRMAETVTGALAAQRAFVATRATRCATRSRPCGCACRTSRARGHDGDRRPRRRVEEAERLSTLLDGCSCWPARAGRAAGRRRRRRGRRGPGRGVAASGRAHRAVPAPRRHPRPRRRRTGRCDRDRAGRRARQRGQVLPGRRLGDRAHGRPRRRRRDLGPRHRPWPRVGRAGPRHRRFWRSPTQSNVEGSGLGSRSRPGRSSSRAAHCAWSVRRAAGCAWWRGCRSRRATARTGRGRGRRRSTRRGRHAACGAARRMSTAASAAAVATASPAAAARVRASGASSGWARSACA